MLPGEIADGGNEEKDSDQSGDEAGDDQQNTGNDDERPMNDLTPGFVALVLSQTPQCAKALDAEQHRAGDGGQNDKEQRLP